MSFASIAGFGILLSLLLLTWLLLRIRSLLREILKRQQRIETLQEAQATGNTIPWDMRI